MQSMQENHIVELILCHKREVTFPEGLWDFSSVKEFILCTNLRESPLFWLESIEFPGLTFIMVDPYLVLPDYDPEISGQDKETLQIGTLDECLLLCFVNTKEIVEKGITIDLSKPIAINWSSGLGKHVKLVNKNEYPSDCALTEKTEMAAA